MNDLFYVKSLLCICMTVMSVQTKAQQEPAFTQFQNTKNYFNPGTSGLNYKIQANALARTQWVGVNGAPETQFVNYSMILSKIHGGIGVNYLHEKMGFSEVNKVKLNYSYHLQLSDNGLLSFGVSCGVNNYSVNATWVPPTSAIDPSLQSNNSDTKFTADFGIAYAGKKLNLGLSSTQLNQARYSNSYQDSRHYYFFADYSLNDEMKVEFKPQLLLMTDLVKYSAQLNFIGVLNEKYWLGVGYRTEDAFIAMIGWDIQKKFRLAYSYDLTINKLNSVSRGSHEVCLAFLLK